MIGIIDYGMGNLRSVQKAFEHCGADACMLRDPDQIRQIDKLVLPGVGAFGDGMQHLTERGWIEPIRTFLASGRPFIGICLGMQLLFEGSEEDAAPGELVPGLAMLPGKVLRFQVDREPLRLKVPHMGWNQIEFQPGDPLLAGIEPGANVYFVHSYYVQPARDAGAMELTRTEYGPWFCSAVRRDNIWATQFHPEKSQRVGLRMLANFAALP